VEGDRGTIQADARRGWRARIRRRRDRRLRGIPHALPPLRTILRPHIPRITSRSLKEGRSDPSRVDQLADVARRSTRGGETDWWCDEVPPPPEHGGGRRLSFPSSSCRRDREAVAHMSRSGAPATGCSTVKCKGVEGRRPRPAGELVALDRAIAHHVEAEQLRPFARLSSAPSPLDHAYPGFRGPQRCRGSTA